jgi:hypothetical protein
MPVGWSVYPPTAATSPPRAPCPVVGCRDTILDDGPAGCERPLRCLRSQQQERCAPRPGSILHHRRIDATDAEIDRLVYDLYGLTEQEIAIVEEATRGERF